MGRDKRLEYAASFENCYFFRLLYYAGTQYPIMGALRLAHLIVGLLKVYNFQSNAWLMNQICILSYSVMLQLYILNFYSLYNIVRENIHLSFW